MDELLGQVPIGERNHYARIVHCMGEMTEAEIPALGFVEDGISGHLRSSICLHFGQFLHGIYGHISLQIAPFIPHHLRGF